MNLHKLKSIHRVFFKQPVLEIRIKKKDMQKSKSLFISLSLIVIAAVISMSFKILPLMDASQDFLPSAIYKVNYNFYAKGKDKKIFIKTYLPLSNERQKISKEKEHSKNMEFVIHGEGQNQRGIWRAKNKSRFQTVRYSFIYQGKAVKYIIDDRLSLNQNLSELEKEFLNEADHIEVNHPKIEAIAVELSEGKDDLKSLIKDLYDFVHEMPSAPIRDLTTALAALEQNQASCNGKARLFVALCRNRGIPARLKGGLILEETKKRTSHLWTEVYIKDKWVPFDVLNDHFASLPAHYLELYTGDHFLITHTPNVLFDYNYEISKANLLPFIKLEANQSLENHPISLMELSESKVISKQGLDFLLLLPIGGLLIALIRNVIGLKTFGVFLPILVAYTLTFSGFLTGLVVFIAMNVIVVLLSIPLNRWGLLYTPKIVSILSFTVVCYLILMKIGLKYEFPGIESIGLFPIIIIAIMAERFSRSIDEDGYKLAISTFIQTLIATVMCYIVFASLAIKTLFLIFPELILLCLVLCIVLGKWIGLRLSEFNRFKLLLD